MHAVSRCRNNYHIRQIYGINNLFLLLIKRTCCLVFNTLITPCAEMIQILRKEELSNFILAFYSVCYHSSDVICASFMILPIEHYYFHFCKSPKIFKRRQTISTIVSLINHFRLFSSRNQAYSSSRIFRILDQTLSP